MYVNNTKSNSEGHENMRFQNDLVDLASLLGISVDDDLPPILESPDTLKMVARASSS